MQNVLGFSVQGRFLGLPITLAQEVIPYRELRPLPQAPDFVRGSLEYRGEPLLVLDLAVRLGWGRCAGGHIAVIELDEHTRVGLLLDKIEEVFPWYPSEIQKPEVQPDLPESYLLGRAGSEPTFLILNWFEIFKRAELHHLHETFAPKPPLS